MNVHCRDSERAAGVARKPSREAKRHNEALCGSGEAQGIMSKPSNPQQQLVPADDRDRQEGEQVPERLIPAEVADLEAELRRTYSLWERALRSQDLNDLEYWRGYRDALRGRLCAHRRKAATGGNGKLCDGAPEASK